MDVLTQYGFSIEEIQGMLDTNILIESVEDRDIYELIELLKSIGCNIDIIRNIFLCNPFCLSNSLTSTRKLIDKLQEFGLDYLFVLFDKNPYLLNINELELDSFYQKMKKEGMMNEDIFEYLSYHFIY